MPDYDPQNIPTLDDIIEEDVADKANVDKTEAVERAEVGPVEEGTIDAFNAESTDVAVDESTDIPEDIPENISGDITEETETDEPLHYPTTPHVSVQIAYEEAYDKSSNFSDADETETSATEDDTSSDDNTLIPIEPIELASVVEDVVKQLLPDMERQLRFLIQQALEERLPEAVLRSVDTTTPTESETEIENA